MINRIQDYKCFDDKVFAELEAKLSMKKQASYNNEEQAKLHSAITNGTVKRAYNTYSVTNPAKIDYHVAMDNNMFKKVGWGEYLYAGFTGSDGFSDKYGFDDGSIWYIERDAQGNEYLVKQIDDKDELVRVASNNMFINEDNAVKVAQLLNIKGIEQNTINFLKRDNAMLNIAFKMLNNDLIKYIQQYSTNKQYIESKRNLKNALIVAIKSINKINNVNDLNIVIDSVMR